MTDQTDYLIKVKRADGERAEGFPDLQTQPQMLPAGWGGTSTVHVCASMASVDDGIRFSVARPNSSYDVPAVLRCRSSPHSAITDNGYKAFIKRVTVEAKKKIFGGLPTTFLGLHKLAIPEPLERLLKEFASANYSEDDIVRAFYQALIEHDGSVDINEKFLKKMHAIVGSQTLNPELVSRILETLNTLWNERFQGSGLPADRYDIPAFLRSQAD